ncbi:hypothetical protein ACAN107058_13775 [Paracidovorax anthurii]|uniref:Uncharacterized protein n=1 Tax=Paracidovorax anthurii TaxID=78229 RepID=A0A328YY02_9BURK|nr:hypothetical protein AX018_103513 [Paracidovorax anthurii]
MPFARTLQRFAHAAPAQRVAAPLAPCARMTMITITTAAP